MSSDKADEGYKIINYRDHIFKWLNVVKKEDNISPQLSNLIEQYIEAIEPLTIIHKWVSEEKRSINDVPKKYKQEFKSLLELYFWIFLKGKIEATISENIDRRRRFTYQKIDKQQKTNARSYGIIIDNYRIQNDYINKKLILSRGTFNENNNWVKEKMKIIEDYPFNSLDNINSAKLYSEELFQEFHNFITNSQS